MSPRSGRAVSRAAAQPYLDKMFVLPAFLLDPKADADGADIQNAFSLLGHFLERRVYLPNGLTMPAARAAMDVLARRAWRLREGRSGYKSRMSDIDEKPSDETVSLKQALESRYLAYALSTITNRALPDVRDGLKPVHRRLLYAMRQLRLDPENGFKKSARVVGDVIGRYHPHGDQAVYDALVRLAQDFAVRYPLVDGQGNFGNVDGDNAAAMRYTEVAYDRDCQPAAARHWTAIRLIFAPLMMARMPSRWFCRRRFPILLANGASGIAVGMATSIPSHNVDELCAAALHLLKAPNARVDTLMEHVKGPDFPTGGICIESPEALKEAYATGRGSMRIRSRYEVEDKGRGTWQIVITEIPYQIQKSRLIEKIAELMNAEAVADAG